MTADRTPLLVLGLGNILCGDDGAGVDAVERLLQRWEIPDPVRVLDGGTLGLSLLPYLRSAERAILVDAVLLDEAPGTIVRFDGSEVLTIARGRMSCHQVGVSDVFDCARLIGDMPEVTLVGIVAANVNAMAAPTIAVSARIDDLVEHVVEEIRANGFEVTARASEPEPYEGATAEEPPHGTGIRNSLFRTLRHPGFRGSL